VVALPAGIWLAGQPPGRRDRGARGRSDGGAGGRSDGGAGGRSDRGAGGRAAFGLICVRTGYPAVFAVTGALILDAVPFALRERKAVVRVARPR
jgi:hypothetical protein